MQRPPFRLDLHLRALDEDGIHRVVGHGHAEPDNGLDRARLHLPGQFAGHDQRTATMVQHQPQAGAFAEGCARVPEVLAVVERPQVNGGVEERCRPQGKISTWGAWAGPV